MAAPTPELAAISDIQAQHCRVIASRTVGDWAFVLLDTGSESNPCPYGVVCCREDGLWEEVNGNFGSFGCLWTSMSYEDLDARFGFLGWWGEAPPGVDAVRIDFLSRSHEVPVEYGYYLFVADWVLADASPEVVAYRMSGSWRRPSRREIRAERAVRGTMDRPGERTRTQSQPDPGDDDT